MSLRLIARSTLDAFAFYTLTAAFLENPRNFKEIWLAASLSPRFKLFLEYVSGSLKFRESLRCPFLFRKYFFAEFSREFKSWKRLGVRPRMVDVTRRTNVSKVRRFSTSTSFFTSKENIINVFCVQTHSSIPFINCHTVWSTKAKSLLVQRKSSRFSREKKEVGAIFW